jgi:hypothetical protein
LNDSSAVPEYVLSFSAARLVALHLQKQIIRSVAEATLRKVKLSPVRAARRVGVVRFDSSDAKISIWELGDSLRNARFPRRQSLKRCTVR